MSGLLAGKLAVVTGRNFCDCLIMPFQEEAAVLDNLSATSLRNKAPESLSWIAIL